MSNEKDIQLLLEKYEKANPFSALPMLNNEGVLMFYCLQPMKDMVYFLKEYDAVVIKQQNGDELLCFEIFCDKNYSMDEIVAAISTEETKTVRFGFLPKETENGKMEILEEEDTTLFLLASKENIFTDNHVMLPLLSHS